MSQNDTSINIGDLTLFFQATDQLRVQINRVCDQYGIDHNGLTILHALEGGSLQAGQLQHKGYAGSNMNYNLKKLVGLGLVEQTTPEFDKRRSLVSLTGKGSQALSNITEGMQKYQIEATPPSIARRDGAPLNPV